MTTDDNSAAAMKAALLSSATPAAAIGHNGGPPMVPEMPQIPVLVPMPRGPSVFGLSRSEIYRAGAEESGLLVKVASRTFIVSRVMLARLARLQVLVPRRDPRRTKGAG